jgi:tripartite-type tricarboxylate transporter receptor subunit TctC
MKRLAYLVLGLLCAAISGSAAFAQAKFPTRAIKIVVPYGPGSATDAVARFLGEYMRPYINGQAVIVENKPGAFGILAIEEMARSKPDGYTLLLGNVSTSALTPILYRKLYKIDPDKDITPISRISELPGFMMVSPKYLPQVKSLADFVAYAKAHPGKVRYSTTGVGAFTNYEGELWSRKVGIKMIHIPMKEGPPAMVRDMLTGDIQIAEMTMATGAGLVKSGQLRPLAVTTDKRVPEYPDVPTWSEQGYPGLTTSNWNMVFVPSATPEPIQHALFDAITKALHSDALKAAFKTQVTYSIPSVSLEEARTWLKQQQVHWKKVTEEVKLDLQQ